MADMKRRVVYFADEEWTALMTQAGQRGQSASGYLRELVARAQEKTASAPSAGEKVVVTPESARKPFFPDPYKAFRPAPKTGGRK